MKYAKVNEKCICDRAFSIRGYELIPENSVWTISSIETIKNRKIYNLKLDLNNNEVSISEELIDNFSLMVTADLTEEQAINQYGISEEDINSFIKDFGLNRAIAIERIAECFEEEYRRQEDAMQEVYEDIIRSSY